MFCVVIPILLVLGVSGQTPNDANPSSVDFMAGQHINVGSVDISVSATEFCITFNTVGGWYMRENHLWFGTNRDDMPQTRKGNPKIGQFPYSTEFSLPYPTTDEICNPWAAVLTGDPCGQRVAVAAHAAVEKVHPDGSIQGETAWGNGDGLDAGSWAMIFEFEILCTTVGTTPPPINDCVYGDGDETAWAFGNTQFWDITLLDGTQLSTRWGWAHCMQTSADTVTTVTQELWAAAGQNLPANGQDVGDVTYDITCATDTCSVVVNVIMEDSCLHDDSSCEDAIMDQVHIDVAIGQDGVWNVAPGQFRVKAEYDTPGASSFQSSVITTACTGVSGACSEAPIAPGDEVCIWTHVNAVGFCET